MTTKQGNRQQFIIRKPAKPTHNHYIVPRMEDDIFAVFSTVFSGRGLPHPAPHAIMHKGEFEIEF